MIITTLQMYLSNVTHNFSDGEIKADNGELTMSLEDILQFVTGTTRVPPLGFDKKPEIEFSNDPLPSASTCLLQLHLPLSQSSMEFEKKCTFSIFNAIGFGNI